MLACIEELLHEVERVSGATVVVQEDPAMSQTAGMTYARHGAPAHVLRYRPHGDPSYPIAVQAGYALRYFSAPADKRLDLCLPDERRAEVMRRLQIPGTLPTRVQNMVVDGLLLQVRSFPVGFRVEPWLRETYPELIDGQVECIHRQLQENVRALSPEVRRSMPKKAVTASTRMNAAFALFWSRLLGEPQQWVPYKATGYESEAQSLLSVLEVVPAGPEYDTVLVDQWAQKLALSGLYEWVPHHA